MLRTKCRAGFGAQLPEIAACAGVHRQGVVAKAICVIQQYIALANGGEGIAILRQCDRKVRFGRQNDIGNDRVTRFWHEVSADKISRLHRGACKSDLPQIITAARQDGQDDIDRPALRYRWFGLHLNIGIKKALPVQNVQQQLPIRSRTLANLGAAICAAAFLLERRKIVKARPDIIPGRRLNRNAIGVFGQLCRCSRIQAIHAQDVAHGTHITFPSLRGFRRGFGIKTCDRRQGIVQQRVGHGRIGQ